MSSLPPELWHLVAIELEILTLAEVLELACVNRYVSEALLGSKWTTDQLKSRCRIESNAKRGDWNAARLSLARQDKARDISLTYIFTETCTSDPESRVAEHDLFVREFTMYCMSYFTPWQRGTWLKRINPGDRAVIEPVLGYPLNTLNDKEKYQLATLAVSICDVDTFHAICTLIDTWPARVYHAPAQTLLHVAAKTGCVETALAVLNVRPKTINARNGRGKTPIVIAIENEQIQMAYFLASQLPRWDDREIIVKAIDKRIEAVKQEGENIAEFRNRCADEFVENVSLDAVGV